LIVYYIKKIPDNIINYIAIGIFIFGIILILIGIFTPLFKKVNLYVKNRIDTKKEILNEETKKEKKIIKIIRK